MAASIYESGVKMGALFDSGVFVKYSLVPDIHVEGYVSLVIENSNGTETIQLQPQDNGYTILRYNATPSITVNAV